jgi:hypothetical protein
VLLDHFLLVRLESRRSRDNHDVMFDTPLKHRP